MTGKRKLNRLVETTNSQCVSKVTIMEGNDSGFSGGNETGEMDMLAAGDAEATTRNEDESIQNHPFLKAMQFDLVVEQLLKYLNFEDAKALSAVSKDCLTSVRKTKSFSNRARLILGKEVITSGILKESAYLWKHLDLDLSIPSEVVDLVEDILESVVSLSLRLPFGSANVSDADLCQYLMAIFKKTKGLRELELNIEIMNKVLHDLFASVEMQQVFTNLQSLEFRECPGKPNSVYFAHSMRQDDDDNDDGDDDSADSPFQRNFLQLSQLPLHLKKFAFGKVIIPYASDWMKFIPNTVETSKATLETLELHYPVWNYEEMKAIRCPNLKRLVLSSHGSDLSHRSNIETFIKNQPPLEELVFEMKGDFPARLMLCLQGMLSRMKKLSLKVKRFTDTTEPIDWTFLGTMDKLEEFYLRKPYAYDDDISLFGRGEEIIEKLPTTVKKIATVGIHPFWRDNVENNNIGTLLRRFENLTELNLIRSNYAVTDDGLQSLISKFPKLTALAFSHCPEVSDYGITGVRSVKREGAEPVQENSGISLGDLKGLIKLKIRSCPNITPECLLSVVKFDHLRSFDYYKNVQLPKDFLFQIVRQNPCLEKVALHIGSYDNDQEYINDLKKEVKKLNPRLHFLEILEQSNWEDEDSDTDADNDDVNDGDSDFSGGGYPDRYGFGADVDYDDDYDESPDEFDDYGDDYDVY